MRKGGRGPLRPAFLLFGAEPAACAHYPRSVVCRAPMAWLIQCQAFSCAAAALPLWTNGGQPWTTRTASTIASQETPASHGVCWCTMQRRWRRSRMPSQGHRRSRLGFPLWSRSPSMAAGSPPKSEDDLAVKPATRRPSGGESHNAVALGTRQRSCRRSIVESPRCHVVLSEEPSAVSRHDLRLKRAPTLRPKFRRAICAGPIGD
jgi:hypothetical protein